MAIDWKTILSEFDGKPTLLQAIGKLRKAVEDEKITIEQAQTEIDNLEAQQKVDEAKIEANATAIQSARLEAEQALSLAQTNEQDIGVLDGEVAGLNNNKLDKSTNITVRGQVYAKDTDGTQTMFDVTTGLYPLSLVRRNFDGQIFINEATEEKNAVNFGQFTDLMRDRLKTLFGNKSIVGYGNIDLYKHHIEITGSDGEAPPNFGIAGITPVIFEFYSSKNTVCDSLTDLKTLLGDTFLVNANGWLETMTGGYQVIYVSETYIYYIKDSAVAKTPLIFTISDTVTTI